MTRKTPPRTFIVTTTLFLAVLAFVGTQAEAEDPAPAAQENESEFSVDVAGRMEVDGEEFKEPAADAPTARILAEVDKAVPSIEGSTLLYLRPVEWRVQTSDGKVATTQVKGEAKPFLYHIDMKLYDAEGKITEDPQLAYRVLMDNPGSPDRLFFDVIWNECDGNVTGNYVGYKCSRKRGMSDEFAAYLKANILSCVNAGLANVGGGRATRVHIVHDGTIADEKHSSKSLHAAGRAVDVRVMKVTTTNGRTTDYVFQEASRRSGTASRKYFEGLRSCWNRLQMQRKCPRRGGGPTGTIGWEDRRHQHHLHLSMPFCPNKRGHFITGF